MVLTSWSEHCWNKGIWSIGVIRAGRRAVHYRRNTGTTCIILFFLPTTRYPTVSSLRPCSRLDRLAGGGGGRPVLSAPSQESRRGLATHTSSFFLVSSPLVRRSAGRLAGNTLSHANILQDASEYDGHMLSHHCSCHVVSYPRLNPIHLNWTVLLG
jgi:hypothetical protein